MTLVNRRTGDSLEHPLDALDDDLASALLSAIGKMHSAGMFLPSLTLPEAVDGAMHHITEALTEGGY